MKKWMSVYIFFIAFLLVACLIAIFLTGCMSTKAVRLGGSFRVPVPVEMVVIYRTADQVKGEYEEIALLAFTGETTFTSEAGMWKSLQKKAGKMGANGVILDAVSEPSAGSKILGAFLGIGSNRKAKAVAIFVFPKK